jgi:hypothetical protein
LWWKLRAATYPTGGKAPEESFFEPAHFQSERLQPKGTD